MIICKYQKTDTAVYMPHLDMLRAFGMAIRRKGLQVNFSDGFNPHARLFFTQPLPLGTHSLCEYLCVDSPENATEFMNKLNTSLPTGVKILKSAYVKDNPNPANLMFKADYLIKPSKPLPKDLDFNNFLAGDTFEIEFQSKGETKKKEVKSMIYGVCASPQGVLLTTSCGNVNLRGDRLYENLMKKAGLEVDLFDTVKLKVYCKDNRDLDEHFF